MDAIDRHPAEPRVLLVSPCSGHSFKFCAGCGEIIADLVQRDRTGRDIGPPRLGRFGGSA